MFTFGIIINNFEWKPRVGGGGRRVELLPAGVQGANRGGLIKLTRFGTAGGVKT